MSPLKGEVGGAEVAHLLSPGRACAKALVAAVAVELVDEEDDVAELDESLDRSVESNWLAAPAAAAAIMANSGKDNSVEKDARILPALMS